MSLNLKKTSFELHTLLVHGHMDIAIWSAFLSHCICREGVRFSIADPFLLNDSSRSQMFLAVVVVFKDGHHQVLPGVCMTVLHGEKLSILLPATLSNLERLVTMWNHRMG